MVVNEGVCRVGNSKVIKILALLFSTILLVGIAHGATINFETMLSALKSNAEPIMRFVVATAYVIGFWFIAAAIMELKKTGQSMTMQSQVGISGPLVKFVMGILLIYLPSTIDIGIATFWGESGGIMSYVADTADVFAPVKEGAIAVVKVVGYISLVKGLVILSKSAEQGTQQGTFSKGFTHVIGGILAINVVGTIRVITSTLGIDVF